MNDTLFFIKANCTKCKACLPVCPAQCIYFGLKQYVIDADRCVSCGKCKAVCPDNAIETKSIEENRDRTETPNRNNKPKLANE